MKKAVLFMTMLFLMPAVRVSAQADWLDALLPANHILEKLPLVDDGGKPLPVGLFMFEDFNNDGRKDLLLAHREAVPTDRLDQPHPQALAVCLFDPARKSYKLSMQDEGGPLKWVRIMTHAKTNRRFLVLEREDWQAETSLRAYTLGSSGKMEKVLETQSPWSYANVDARGTGIEILYSGRSKPAAPSQAEAVFTWKESSLQFVDSKEVPFARRALLKQPTPTPMVVAAKPTATPAPPATTAARPAAAQASAKPASTAPSVAGAWWPQPFSAPDAYAKLTEDLIPRRVKGNQLTPLGQEAKAFFDQLHAAGIGGDEYSDYRAGYLTVVATQLYGLGDKERGAYYLDLVLKYRPQYQPAIDLKAKVGAP